MTYTEELLRYKADLFRRTNRLGPTVSVAEREAEEDFDEVFRELDYKYKTVTFIRTGWSDRIISINPDELLTQPQQESLF